jgi:DNA-3-methyladenine glycosylase
MVQKMIRASFFRRDPLTCARELIGTELIWGECSGVVVEVEAYAAIDDEAAHTFTRPSARSFIERNKAGTAYVYFNYGVHWMLNVLVKGNANGFVLIRALEPRQGIELMKRRRGVNDLRQLCSGPGKITQAFAISGRHHEIDLCSDPATASSPTHVRLSMLSRTNASASAGLRIFRGDLLFAAVLS